MNITARLFQVALAGFLVALPTICHFSSKTADTADRGSLLTFLYALVVAWLACALFLFSRKEWAWWACLVFSTLAVFVPLYFTCLFITDAILEHSGAHPSLVGISVNLVPIVAFGLHLRTRAEYFKGRIEDASSGSARDSNSF